MRSIMKTGLAALGALALIPAAVTAHEVRGTHPGTITALTTYPSSGKYHGAIDIGAGGQCNYWGAETGVVGSVSWTVTIRTTGIVCYGSGSGNQNEAKHVFADGWTFRLWHFNKTASSYDSTSTAPPPSASFEPGTGTPAGNSVFASALNDFRCPGLWSTGPGHDG